MKYLSHREIDQLFGECNHDKDEKITFNELERILDDVYQEIAPTAERHHLHHESKRDERHTFLHGLLQGRDSLTREQFHDVVQEWKIPSQSEEQNKASQDASKIPLLRRLRAHWSVDGPPYVFLIFLVSLMLIFGLWQLITYLKSPTRHALGWGVVVAKGTAGVLYPTLFFMILSMSRHLATIARNNYFLCRFVNIDKTQSFHIKISIFALVLATIHSIGHLTGTFLYSSRPGREATVAAVVGRSRTYIEYIRLLPAITGLAAIGIFYLIALGSVPWIRRKNYEIFQFVHLLMFPFIGLLMAHGTKGILQAPMLGYWLAFPTLLVLYERLHRLYRGFVKVNADANILDEETIVITCYQKNGRPWRYEAGQYVLLQVPQIGFFQWHPFTISTCSKDKLQLHIKNDGDWTSRLFDVCQSISHVGVDGPFGAPAQRFYDFRKTVVIGLGIGVTPLSGILNDLEQKLTSDSASAQTETRSRSRRMSRSGCRSRSQSRVREKLNKISHRCDFHWMVRDKNAYLWFSDLLNRVQQFDLHENLDLRIYTHLTMKRKRLSTLIFRYLLDNHRPESSPHSKLTGLVNPTQFGRADFPQILSEHYEEMKQCGWDDKVGVFYCGSPVVGRIIADQCNILTARARQEGRKIKYHFMMEVFG